ncbi:MAG TPA: hypothetical protein VKW08_19520 [Xanthobacteraceae bacterium]|jgi:hypothetical protein|nr:hypothetical protein [Xanthobacteraceae bacterium]
MRWVVALFVALLSIPVAQVVADGWYGRPGPELLVVPAYGAGTEERTLPRAEHPNFNPARHSRYRLYGSFAPWFAHSRAGDARTG